MSRRHKRPRTNGSVVDKPRSIYLEPDFDSIQAAIEESLGQTRGTAMNVTTPYGLVGGASYSSGNNYKDCGGHAGDALVFDFGGKKLFGASWSKLHEYSDAWDLIIDLAGNVKPKQDEWDLFIKPISTAAFADELASFVPTKLQTMSAQLLSLRWPDMGVAPVGLDFWQFLWSQLPPRTVVACHGGHGRTGTCLAALMIIAGLDYWSAIETVRKEHCEKAIESLGQEQYLHRLYVERLKEQIAEAAKDGNKPLADELAEDLVYAQKHTPTAVTTTATKHYGSVTPINGSAVTVASDTYQSFGKIQATKFQNGKAFYLRCTWPKCAVHDCFVGMHLQWIPADGGAPISFGTVAANGLDEQLLAGELHEDMWGV